MRSFRFGLCSLRIFVLSFTSFFIRIAAKGQVIIIFPVFHFYSLTSIHLVYRDFYHFFLIDLFVYHTDSWSNLFSLEICILFAFSLMQLSCSYWLSFQSGIVRIWAHIKQSPFYYKANVLTKWDWHPYPPLSIYHIYPTLPQPLIIYPFTKMYKKWTVFHFLQEIGRKITKSIFTVLKQEMIFSLISRTLYKTDWLLLMFLL